MKKLDNDVKVLVTALIGAIGLFVMLFAVLTENDRCARTINEYEEQIKYKDEVIESQAKMLIENEYNNCYCGWYEDFYYQHSNEVGAYE